ncbi:MAG: SagB/ThcOx family dehydrogenase [Anaerolineales bacterium]
MSIKTNRQFMKSDFAESVHERSDQAKGLPFPPLQKEVPAGSADLITLPGPDPSLAVKPDFYQLLQDRESRRQYTKGGISLAELSYLLYCTQGVKELLGDGYASRRVVPSGGARHPFETYLAVNRVETLTPGIYRYLPLDHQLTFLEASQNLPELLTEANLGQRFVGQAACVFAWSCIPYRAEWRYMNHAHKNMLLDAGHICQNLYLAAEALGLGVCAIGAYDQSAMDALLELDGEDEYVVYLAPVGKI